MVTQKLNELIETLINNETDVEKLTRLGEVKQGLSDVEAQLEKKQETNDKLLALVKEDMLKQGTSEKPKADEPKTFDDIFMEN